MRTAARYHIIADDGKIHRLARTTFYDLIQQKIPTPFPEFKGKRVKLATVHVRIDGPPHCDHSRFVHLHDLRPQWHL